MEAFFLPAETGKRYCLYTPPRGQSRDIGILYVHPFAEEMNKSRRMAALQARRFAREGFAVLQLDLFGCGDSSGDFGDATWEKWKRDVSLGYQWLGDKGKVALWGLRLGALLVLDFAASSDCEFLMLWQPVLNGESFLTQFLRLRLANEMLADGAARTRTSDLRGQLAAGQTLEVAGYQLAPDMATAIDNLQAARMTPHAPLFWAEIMADASRPVPAARRNLANSWPRCEMQIVEGEPFWSTQEIHECSALLDTTSDWARAR